jgi:hypothetical protein
VTARPRPISLTPAQTRGCVMDKKTFDEGVEVRTAVRGKQYVENALK